MCNKIVCYYRVSTKRQGQSGLGLEAQRSAAEQYYKPMGKKLVAEVIEVESGKRHENRPKLAEALALCKSTGAMLVIAKLDRLARNVAFTSALMENGVPFVCCDNPTANKLTIHILAAVAEDEARRISERTRVALQAAKARGTLLGSARPGHWDGLENKRLKGIKKAREVSAQVRTKLAQERNRFVCKLIAELRATGATWEATATALNEAGHVTARGNSWTTQSAYQVAQGVCSNMEPSAA